MSATVEAARRPVARPATRIRRMRKNRAGRVLLRMPFYLLIAAIAFYCLFPFYWVLRSSFTAELNLFHTPIKYFPAHPTLANYRGSLSANFFTHPLVNSAIVVGSVTHFSLLTDPSAAFALGRFR